MEHTRLQEGTWRELCKTVTSEISNDYDVDGDISHQLTISRQIKPIKKVILNFAGEDLFIHFEEDGPQSLPQPVRVNEDGTLCDLRTNSVVTMAHIASQVRTYLAA